MTKKLACKIGLHKYDEWRISPLQALSSNEDNVFSYVKKCKYCKAEKFKDFNGLMK